MPAAAVLSEFVMVRRVRGEASTGSAVLRVQLRPGTGGAGSGVTARYFGPGLPHAPDLDVLPETLEEALDTEDVLPPHVCHHLHSDPATGPADTIDPVDRIRVDDATRHGASSGVVVGRDDDDR
jgi:hypothetical protein